MKILPTLIAIAALVASVPEWSVWRRGSPATSTLTLMTGQTGYLVKVTTSVTTLNVPITYTPLPPRAVWVRNGANLLGFPTKQTSSTYPTFASYFSGFTPATSGKIYKYIGGELSTTNPLQLFSTSTERVDRNQAYWFETQAVENFHGPHEITVSNPAGVDFGRIGSAATAREYPLRFIVHMDAAGTARILSQVFIGKLAPAPHDVGLCTLESVLKQDEKTGARRIVAAHLPLDRAISAGGTFGLGGTLTGTVSLPFSDPTNPFVHQYHPDHDNKNARFQPVGAGVESYNVSRALTFTFASTPPPGTSALGWGSTVVAGTYAETITGLHKQSVSVSGTFELRRVSELGAITLN